MNPKVSIIMNCYNGEEYIYEAIKSVINQKYRNWELIIWDNQSIDKSEKIISLIKDKRLRYYKSKKFTNLSEARNLAIEKSFGEIITFLDVDDIWLDNKLSIQVEFFLKNKYKLIYCNFLVKNENKKKTKLYSNKRLPEGNITQLLLNNYCVGLLTIMISKKILKDIYFDPIFTIIGDFDLVIRISKKYKIGCIQYPLAIYRKHNSNDSILNLERQIQELNSWYEKKLKDKTYKYFDLSGIKNKLVFMNFENNFNKNNIIKMLQLFPIQKDFIYLLKMILYIILPKFVVEHIKK